MRDIHESALRLNLCIPKLCVEEMCSSCVSIVMLYLPFYVLVGMGLKCKLIIKDLITLGITQVWVQCGIWWQKITCIMVKYL